MAVIRTLATALTIVMTAALVFVDAGDTNEVYSPCMDSKVKLSDGFSFGIAFASRDKFFYNNTQLSPCDSRLSLSSSNSQISLFRPKLDEISLLTINSSNFSPVRSLSQFLAVLLVSMNFCVEYYEVYWIEFD